MKNLDSEKVIKKVFEEIDSIQTVTRVLAKFVIDWCGWDEI